MAESPTQAGRSDSSQMTQRSNIPGLKTGSGLRNFRIGPAKTKNTRMVQSANCGIPWPRPQISTVPQAESLQSPSPPPPSKERGNSQAERKTLTIPHKSHGLPRELTDEKCNAKVGMHSATIIRLLR